VRDRREAEYANLSATDDAEGVRMGALSSLATSGSRFVPRPVRRVALARPDILRTRLQRVLVDGMSEMSV
jgi:hypothetical protein